MMSSYFFKILAILLAIAVIVTKVHGEAKVAKTNTKVENQTKNTNKTLQCDNSDGWKNLDANHTTVDCKNGHCFGAWLTGSGDAEGLFSCESDFDGNDFNKTMTIIEDSTFLKTWRNTTEKMKGTFFAKDAGLTASANFTADDGMIKKILNGTEFLLSLDFNLKIDNVKLSAKTIVENVDLSDFYEPDNVTVCFGKSQDCQDLFELTIPELFGLPAKIQNASEVTVFANSLELKEVEIEGDVSSIFSKFFDDEEAFQIKLEINAHAASDLVIDIAINGNTTIDDIEKLDDDDGEIFDGDILNALTHFKGQICIGTECADFIECSDNLCNHHQENKSTTTTTTTTTTIKPIIPAKTTTTKTSTNTTKITTKSTTTTTTIKTETTTMKNTTEKPKQDKNKLARGFGYFCAVVIIFAIGGLVFYYYRKRRNETMTSRSDRSEYAELVATHI